MSSKDDAYAFFGRFCVTIIGAILIAVFVTLTINGARANLDPVCRERLHP